MHTQQDNNITFKKWSEEKAIELYCTEDINNKNFTNLDRANYTKQAPKLRMRVIEKLKSVMYISDYYSQNILDQVFCCDYIQQLFNGEWGFHELSQPDITLLNCIYKLFIQNNPLSGSNIVPISSAKWETIPINLRRELYNAIQGKYGQYEELSQILEFLEYKLLEPKKFSLYLPLFQIAQYARYIDVEGFCKEDNYNLAVKNLNCAVKSLKQLYKKYEDAEIKRYESSEDFIHLRKEIVDELTEELHHYEDGLQNDTNGNSLNVPNEYIATNSILKIKHILNDPNKINSLTYERLGDKEIADVIEADLADKRKKQL